MVTGPDLLRAIYLMQSKHSHVANVDVYRDGRAGERCLNTVKAALLHGTSHLKPKSRNHRLDIQIPRRLSLYQL
ncbi:MAG: hypothetical protein ACI8UD_000564 [Planctomycetota bacterium]|jgi:hypothetical protein